MNTINTNILKLHIMAMKETDQTGRKERRKKKRGGELNR